MNYRNRIKQKGLKIVWLADKIGVSQPKLSLFLKGERNLHYEEEQKLQDLLK